MQISERPAECEFFDEVEEACLHGLARLRLHRSQPPKTIISAIDNAVLQLCRDPAAVSNEEKDQLVAEYGALWGEQLVNELKWNWVQLTITSDDGSSTNAQAVVSPNRSLVIYPFFSVDAAIRQSIDTAIERAFDLLCDGKRVPKLADFAYVNVMEHVYHTPARAGKPQQ